MKSLSEITHAAGTGINVIEYPLTCPKHGPGYGIRVVDVRGHVIADCGCCKCDEERRAAEAKEESDRAAAEKLVVDKARLEQALKSSAIPVDYQEKSFANFITKTTCQRQALALAKRYVSGWEKAKEGGYGLLFYGKPGTGKSHLACAILHELLAQHVLGLYTRASDILQYIRGTWQKGSPVTTYDAIRRYSEIPLLVVDELGIQAGTENERQILFSIIDARIAEGRPSIFLTNLRPQDLVPLLGERLIDRINSKCVGFRFEGASMRKPISQDVFGGAV